MKCPGPERFPLAWRGPGVSSWGDWGLVHPLGPGGIPSDPPPGRNFGGEMGRGRVKRLLRWMGLGQEKPAPPVWPVLRLDELVEARRQNLMSPAEYQRLHECEPVEPPFPSA